jgi:hypothetical protein
VATGAPLGVDVALGALAAALTVVGLLRFMNHRYGTAPTLDEPLFPTSPG